MSSREKEQEVKEEEIRKEAKLILDKFAKELEKIKEIPESFVEREEDRREEKASEEGKKPDDDFRKIFFENAPATKKSCVLAERGKWK